MNSPRCRRTIGRIAHIKHNTNGNRNGSTKKMQLNLTWHGEDGGGGSTAAVKPKRTLGASENQTHAVGARTTAVGGGGEMETMILKAKAKPFPPCTHCGFNDHIPNDYRNYPECKIYGSYDHSTLGLNHVIQIRGGVLAKSSQSNESSIGVKCDTCGSTVHSTTDHNEFDHFKKGEQIQAAKAREPTQKKLTQVYYLCRDTSGSPSGT
ncbi:hypothetical protein Tco_1134051 [Tanacetum coccineum]